MRKPNMSIDTAVINGHVVSTPALFLLSAVADRLSQDHGIILGEGLYHTRNNRDAR